MVSGNIKNNITTFLNKTVISQTAHKEAGKEFGW